MKLFIELMSFCAVRNEFLDSFEFLFPTRFKARRVVKDKLRIAAEGERTIDRMNTTLIGGNTRPYN